MQRFFFIIISVFSLFNCHGQSKKDSLAIYDLLVKEAATWRAADAKGHADCWAVRPYSRILISTGDGKVIEVPPTFMLNAPPSAMGNGGHAIISNIKINISGKKGWVSHDEESISKDGKSNFTCEIRFLEKVNKQWKMIGQSIHVDKERKLESKKVGE